LMHCVQQQSIKDPERWKPPDRSVADSMSDRLDKNIKATKTDGEASLVIVHKKIWEADDNYAVLNGQLEDFGGCLDKFEEFLTKRRDNMPPTDENSEDGSVYDILGLHFYKCAFCTTIVDTNANLKVHIESVHLDDVFKFRMLPLRFQCRGSKGPRQTKKIVHSSYGDSNTTESAVSNLEADAVAG
jgi:hypothetical protein